MKAAEKLKSLAGGHMKESIGGSQGGGVALRLPGPAPRTAITASAGSRRRWRSP